jgi:hypothetical protein
MNYVINIKNQVLPWLCIFRSERLQDHDFYQQVQAKDLYGNVEKNLDDYIFFQGILKVFQEIFTKWVLKQIKIFQFYMGMDFMGF